MKKYIFITSEGFTFQPDSDSFEPDIENLQVIGFGEGCGMEEAFKRMLKENKYLLATSFNEITGFEIKDECRKNFNLNDYKIASVS